MTKHQHDWIGVCTADGKLLRIDCRHCTSNRSFGRAAKADRVELRAARLAADSSLSTPAEETGYVKHADSGDPKSAAEWAGWLEREIAMQAAAEWAGWLEREIAMQDAPSKINEDALIAAIAHCPDREPAPDWKERVLEECDAIDEQTRHDVSASVARHAGLTEVPGERERLSPTPRYDIDDPDSVNPISGLTNRRIDEIADDYLRESMCDGDDSVLDSVDQSEPVPAPEATLRDVDTDEEPTHVGDVDARFDSTETE